jgi:hypothetical protein
LKEKGEELKEEKDTAAVTFDGDDLVVCEDAYVNLACHESMWVVDMAASFHITPHRDFFSSYISGNFGWVRMGNEAKCEILGMGDIQLETNIGCKLLLKNVRYASEMCFSLITIGKLDDECDDPFFFFFLYKIFIKHKRVITVARLRVAQPTYIHAPYHVPDIQSNI